MCCRVPGRTSMSMTGIPSCSRTSSGVIWTWVALYATYRDKPSAHSGMEKLDAHGNGLTLHVEN